MVYKVILSTGKVVTLREPKIKHREIAAQSISGKSKDDQFTFVVLMAKEMLRLLIHSIDGKLVSAKDLLDIDSVFTYKEYLQLEAVMKKINEDEEGENGPFVPAIEQESIGGN